MGFTLWGARSVKGGEGRMTVGGDAVVDVGTWTGVELGGVSNSVAMLNLNGGTLKCPYISAITNNTVAQRTNGKSWPAEYGLDTAQRYIYFNGTTIENSGSALADMFVWPQMTRATVGPGGAVFNITDTRRVYVNLTKPSGKGVASVPFTCDVPKRYIGSPFIQITGNGTGASAHAEFDPDTYTITGVTVTSPGNDYTTATAKIQLGGYTQTVDVNLDACLADNATDGGVTVKGTGDLVLYGTNTYEGVSRAAGGNLYFAETNALPPKSVLEVAGGEIHVKKDNNVSYADATVAGLRGTGAGGTIRGKTLKTDVIYWNPTNHATIAINGSLVLASNAKIVVEEPENLDDTIRSLPVLTVTNGTLTGPATLAVEGVGASHRPWRARLVGNAVRFGSERGFMLIVR